MPLIMLLNLINSGKTARQNKHNNNNNLDVEFSAMVYMVIHIETILFIGIVVTQIGTHLVSMETINQ
jgi:hypothetical protein